MTVNHHIVMNQDLSSLIQLIFIIVQFYEFKECNGLFQNKIEVSDWIKQGVRITKSCMETYLN